MNIEDRVKQMRTDYTQSELKETSVDADPIAQFKSWLAEVIKAEVQEPHAMCLSTVRGRQPHSRIVLLRGIDERGFKFHTNYNSNKGSEINTSSFASLNFFWKELERQVRVEGKVEKLTTEESDTYFTSRPRESQIGAWASQQSQELNSREELENLVREFTAKFDRKEVPRPKYWGGYALIPERIEFWQGRQSRLHDRLLYFKEDGNWKIKRLFP